MRADRGGTIDREVQELVPDAMLYIHGCVSAMEFFTLYDYDLL